MNITIMTTSAAAPSTGLRQSPRKRQSPVRYGFDDAAAQTKRRRQTDSPRLVDLPVEILRTVCGLLCTPSDRFALAATNRLFRNLSGSPELLRTLRLLPTLPQDKFAVIQPDDSSEKVVRRLLPFARNANWDALFLLGRLAVYVEDDVPAGMALWTQGMELGDLRCQYELANLLVRHRENPTNVELGRRWIEEAAVLGHTSSQLCSNPPTANDDPFSRMAMYADARREMRSTRCLGHLLRRKSPPPRPMWTGSSCSNPLCTRKCYRVRRRRVREWLLDRKPARHWEASRNNVLSAAGTQSAAGDRYALFYVPDFHMCARCRRADYCGKACQVVHWNVHKGQCRPPRHQVPPNP